MARRGDRDEFTLSLAGLEEDDGAAEPAPPVRPARPRRGPSGRLARTIAPWIATGLALTVAGVLIAPPVPLRPGWGLVEDLSAAPRQLWSRTVSSSAGTSAVHLLPGRVVVVAGDEIIGVDRASGADRWTIGAISPRCTDDGTRLVCVAGLGEAAEVLLVDPTNGAAGIAGLPGAWAAATVDDDLVVIADGPEGVQVSRFADAATELDHRQATGTAPAGSADPPAPVADWSAAPAWSTRLPPGVPDWPPAIAVFGSELLVSVARQRTGDYAQIFAVQGHRLDVTTGAVLEDLAQTWPDWLGAYWLVQGDAGGTQVYSPDWDPIPLTLGQQHLEVEDDPTSAVTIGSLESDDPLQDAVEVAMTATDADSGEPLWTRPNEWAVARIGGVVVATTGQGLLGVDESTGTSRWTLRNDSGLLCPCLSDGRVLAGFEVGAQATLVGLDVRTGQRVWEARMDRWWIGAVLDGDRLYTLAQGAGSTLTAWDVG